MKKFIILLQQPIFGLLLALLSSNPQCSENLFKTPHLDNINLQVVVPRDFPPHYMVDDNGHPVGFAIDIMNEIAKAASLKLTYQIKDTWTDVYKTIDSGKADIIPNLGISKKRLKKYDFSVPVEVSHISIFVRKSNTHIKNKNDLINHQIGVVKGNIAVAYFEKQKDIHPIIYSHAQNALFGLLSGEVNAIVYPQQVMRDIARAISIEDRILSVGEPVLEVKRAIAMRKNNSALATRLKYGITQLKQSPKYNEIYIKWYGKQTPFWSITRISWVVSALLLIIIITLLIMRYRSIMRMNSELQASIKDRVQAENNLLERKEEIKNLIESLPLGLALCRMDGSLVEINQAYADIIGRNIDEVLPLSYWDITPEKYSKQESEQLELLKSTGQYGPYTKEYIHKNGQLVPVQLIGRLIQRGDENFIWSVIEDISTRVQTESMLRRTQKMDAIGQLTGGIAHDFNNLLGIILGNIDLLKLQIDDKEKTLIRIEEINKAGNRAAVLTKQLLGFSRGHDGSTKAININKTIIDMNELISRSITPEIKVVNNLAEDLWTTPINAGDFEDSLLNLILNARDATEKHGKISIETRNSTLDTNYCNVNTGVKPGKYVELIVKDTGSGISLDDQEHMFEPFFTTKVVGKGTGLGLSMVFGFIVRSGGHIKCESQLNEGTSFHLYLPVSDTEQAEPVTNKKESEEQSRGSEKVLIVDDEAGLLNFSKSSLQMLGYNIMTADNGKQALDILSKDSTFDLLFSDVVMPEGLNGYELADKVSALYPKIKILLTSGHVGNTEILENQKSLKDNLLNKPYSISELSKKVRKTLDQ